LLNTTITAQAKLTTSISRMPVSTARSEIPQIAYAGP
jgi:hypothetical protein